MSTSNIPGLSSITADAKSSATLGAQSVKAQNAIGQASEAAKAASQIGSALKNAYQDRDAGLF